MTQKDILYSLLLNIDYIKDDSLYYGKSAAILFLFEYDEFYNNDAIYNLACEKLFDLIERFDAGYSGYMFGSLGIGRVLHFLNQEGIVEVNFSHPIFGLIDNEIYKINTSVDLSLESCGTTAYVMDRYASCAESNFEQLLREERIICQIDAIDSFLQTQVLPKAVIRDIYELDNDINVFRFELQNILNASYILKRNISLRIYPSVTQKCIKAVLCRAKDLRIIASDLATNSSYVKSDFLADLEMSIYQLTNIACSLEDLHPSVIMDFFSTYEVINNRIINAACQRTTDSVLEIIRMQRNLLEKLPEEVSQKEDFLMLRMLISDVGLISMSDNHQSTYEGKLNIGITGISKTGLCLLPSKKNWFDLLIKI